MKLLTFLMALFGLAFWIAKALPLDAVASDAAVVEDDPFLNADGAPDVVSSVKQMTDGNEDVSRDARHLWKKKHKGYLIVKRPKCYKCWKFGK